jgi:hypothetical protein
MAVVIGSFDHPMPSITQEAFFCSPNVGSTTLLHLRAFSALEVNTLS